MREPDRQPSRSATRWLALSVCLASGATPTFASCAEIEGSGTSAAIDFNDLWSAAGYPCDGEPRSLTMSLHHQGRTLNALSVAMNDCVARGDQLWHGTLPAETIRHADLPITFAVQFVLRGGAEQGASESAAGAVTVISPDRMLLDAGEVSVVLTRGGSDEATSSGGTTEPAPDAGSRTQPSSRTDGRGDHAAAGESAAKAGSGGATVQGAAGLSVAGSAGMESGKQPPAPDTTVGGQSAPGASGAGAESQQAGAAAPDAAGGGADAGGSGGRGPGVAGTGATEINWVCVDMGARCSCVETKGDDPITTDCLYVRPCCFAVVGDPDRNCQCWTYEGAECDEYVSQGNRMRIPKCPY